MSFSQALSGLNAQSQNLKVISNNIANAQTTGFKNGRISFADIFTSSSAIGLGAQVTGISQDFRSGDLERTGRTLDLAIAGGGFYRLEKTNGDVVYSRNGQFNQDSEGFLVNSTGQRLTGYVMNDGDEDYPFTPVIVGGAPEPIIIEPDDMPASETTDVSTTYNLDASVVPDEGLQGADVIISDPDVEPPVTAEINFHFSTSYTTFDSLGNPRTVTTYYEKLTEDEGGTSTWGATVFLDGARAGWLPERPDPENPPAVLPADPPDYTLNFNASGQLVEDDAITITGGDKGLAAAPEDAPLYSLADGQLSLTFGVGAFELNGAEDLNFNVNLAGTTQFSNSSVQNTLAQDGYTSGTLAGLEIMEDGTVMRIFTNEQRAAAGQIVLANFVNPEGLRPDGDNAWAETVNSGAAVVGDPGTGVLGTILAETLESSNVDLAEQLVNMIVAQRAYQANSTSIGTQDELLQTVINL